MSIYEDIISRRRAFGRTLLSVVGVLVLFFAVSALFFAPQFRGRTLYQHDVMQYEGMWHDIEQNREATGEDAQWTGNLFGGMPAYLINVEYPSQIVKGAASGIIGLMGNPAAFIFFAMVAMWLTTLLFRTNRWVGIIAALAYGLSTYTIHIIGAGHITKIWAMVYAPLMVGAVYYTLRRNMWAGAALTALFTSLEIGANHPQITYYFAIPMATLWISEGVFALKERRIVDWLKRTGLLLVAATIALGSNFSPLWQTMQHQKETTRGGSELATAEGEDKGLDLEYMTRWSYGKAESLNMLIPNYMGGSSSENFANDANVTSELKEVGLEGLKQMPRYFGDQPGTGGPTYLGAVVIFLALFAALILPNRHKWWVIAACIITLLFAWGNNIMWLTELLYKYLPLYDKFRVPATALVVLQWATPLLAAFAIGYTIKKRDSEAPKLRKALCISGGIIGGILLITALSGGILHDAGEEKTRHEMEEMLLPYLGTDTEAVAQSVADAFTEARKDALQDDAWRSLLFVALTFAALGLYIERRRVGKYTLCIAVALLSTVDLYTVDKRYLSEDDFVLPTSARIIPTQADRYILANNKDGARVLNLGVSPFNDATTSYFHRSIGGYHGAKLSRYQDLIDHQLAPMVYLAQNASTDEEWERAMDGIINSPVLDMLNTRYLIFGTKEADVAERYTSPGNGWLVSDVVKVESAEMEMALLSHEAFNPVQIAIAGAEYTPAKEHYPAFGGVMLTEYRPNYLRYEVNCSGGEGLAVFSEIFTREGWSVTIDGVEATPLRVNYVLRAVEVPEGNHIVEWSYRAPAWSITEGITLICSLVIIFGCLAALIVYVLKRWRTTKE